MAAVQLALRCAGNPGDEVIIPVPCWLDYPLYTRFLGLSPVLVPLSGQEFDVDAAAIFDAMTSQTCAVLLSHPSNPAGRNYSWASVSALAQVLERAAARTGRVVTLIADETHRDFTAPEAYCSMARAWPASFIVYSFGKYHFLQGQRTGYLAVSPRHPRRSAVAAEAVRWARIAAFCAPTALMQAAVPELLALRHDLTQVERGRASVSAALRDAGYHVVPAEATLFLYVATPDGRNDFAFIRDLAAAAVLALPAPLFHHRGHFRLSLTAGPRTLERVVAALRKVAAA
jgi:aspartate aminotransferase